MSDKKEREKVCPYNEFALCFKEGGPAYYDKQGAYGTGCLFVDQSISPVRY